MSRTTLQIPLDSTLRHKAENAALSAGFSSVQEVVRVFLNKFASHNIDVGFYGKEIRLSQKSEFRYIPMVHDAKKGKNTIRANSLDELVSILD